MQKERDLIFKIGCQCRQFRDNFCVKQRVRVSGGGGVMGGWESGGLKQGEEEQGLDPGVVT